MDMEKNSDQYDLPVASEAQIFAIATINGVDTK